MLVVPHALIAGVVAAAWAAGVLLGHQPSLVLQLSGALVVIGSLGVIVTEGVPFPSPYDPGLAASWRLRPAESTPLRER
jgi:hypothetical protein